MTTVYSVNHAEGVNYYPTLREARAVARDAKAAGDFYVHVQKHLVTESLGKRELYCALLNSESWAAATAEVFA